MKELSTQHSSADANAETTAIAKANIAVERILLNRLRIWIATLSAVCLITGIGIGVIFAGWPTKAEGELTKVSRAPEALSASFAEIARRVEPAVVNIHTVATPSPLSRGNLDDDSSDKNVPRNPLLDFFSQGRNLPSRSVGSGFIVDSKGFIVTNQHVIEGSSRITVKLQDGEELRGRVVGIDEETDVAIIKVDTRHELPTVKFGDSNATQVGDWVLAIGSPFDLEQTVTAGIISSKDRLTPYSSNFQHFIQTDAAINRGNSGGPLVNMRGEVIGINSQIATLTGDNNGVGFALPSKEAEFVFNQLVTTGKVSRGYLGIFLDPVKREYASVYGLEDTKGAIVSNVYDLQSPAAVAGIKPNDIIVEVNGQPIEDPKDLISQVSITPVGQQVQLAYLRDTGNRYQRHAVNVSVGERPQQTDFTTGTKYPKASETSSPVKENKAAKIQLGITLTELTAQLAADMKLVGVHGLFVKDIDPNGIIADLPQPRLNEEEVIVKINKVNVRTLADFERVANSLKQGDPVVLIVNTRVGGQITQKIIQFTFQ